MKSPIKTITALTCVVSMCLCGCSGVSGVDMPSVDMSAIDMDKINHIVENFNDINEEVSKIDTTEIEESVQNTAEATADLSEWVEEGTSEDTDEENVETADTSDKEDDQTDADEAASDDTDSADESIFDYIDPDALYDLIDSTIYDEINSYKEKGAKLIQEVADKSEKGLAKIQEGADTINEVYSKGKINEESLDSSVTGAEQIVEGTNELSEAATLMLQESVVTAGELIDEADSLGVDTSQISELRKELKKAENIEIVFFDDSITEGLEDLREEIKEGSIAEALDGDTLELNDIEVDVDLDDMQEKLEYMDEIYAQAEDIIKNANESAVYAKELYDMISETADELMSDPDSVLKTLDPQIQETITDTYDAIQDNLDKLPIDEAVEITEELEKLIETVNEQDYEKLVNKLFSAVS